MTKTLIDDCYREAIRLLHQASTEEGFAASAEFEHYRGVWGRDAAISCLAAYASGDPGLLDTAHATLITLADRRSHLGQIPNAVWPAKRYWDWGEGASSDVTPWFIIAAASYVQATSDTSFLDRVGPALRDGWAWLRYQQANNMGLIDQGPGADWMDSSLTRTGKVLYTNVLACWAARELEALDIDIGPIGSAGLSDRINFLFWPQPDGDLAELLSHVDYPHGEDLSFPHPGTTRALHAAARPDRAHYVSHVAFGQVVDRCDVLANALTIVADLAPHDRADRVLDYLDEREVSHPFPSRTWPSPIDPDEDRYGMFVAAADENQPERWRNQPGRYHNGAVWPFVGGFHVLAMTERDRRERAMTALGSLAEGNSRSLDGDWGFHEWLSVPSGEPEGAPRQAWSAASYVLAYRALMAGPEEDPALDSDRGSTAEDR